MLALVSGPMACALTYSLSLCRGSLPRSSGHCVGAIKKCQTAAVKLNDSVCLARAGAFVSADTCICTQARIHIKQKKPKKTYIYICTHARRHVYTCTHARRHMHTRTHAGSLICTRPHIQYTCIRTTCAHSYTNGHLPTHILTSTRTQ